MSEMKKLNEEALVNGIGKVNSRPRTKQ